LLWEYVAAHDALNVLDLPEPELGAPLPVQWHGRLISQDLANGALEAASISRALNGRIPDSILEVGAGYGRTAYVLLSIFPHVTYTIVDIEPAISICRWYLTRLFPVQRLRFLSPDEATEAQPGSFDLGISISSLQEMTPSQVHGYISMFDRLVAGGSVYLKQWREWRNPDDDVTVAFDDYPIPERWKLGFRVPALIQRKFEEAAWDVLSAS
jgi:putative sugar O-methyltransferase